MKNTLAKQIEELRQQLNKLMENNSDYSNIYTISVELDTLIANYMATDKKTV